MVQKPLKAKYRSEPDSSRIKLRVRGSQTDTPISCSVDIGCAVYYEAQARTGVGGPGRSPALETFVGRASRLRPGHLLMAAEAMGIETVRIEVEVEGDLDLRGTLGVSKEVQCKSWGTLRIRIVFAMLLVLTPCV